ncbi:MAG: DUF413 domain-containing protein [Shewanella sp.]|nr:DUF413 domain-containing protein [Shewanella sp.]MCF1431536.1 DUF413 domain-containing protein [Shewanella sp.]MCF1439270.1 DUF413 domain-containing protein [Shewanella sp.]
MGSTAITPDFADAKQPLTGPDAFLSHRKFYDDEHFPKGFNCCGDLTTKEAQILENHGVAMKELAEGKRLPSAVEEIEFVEVLSGKREAKSLFELIWLKYCRISNGKPFYTVSDNPRRQRAEFK